MVFLLKLSKRTNCLTMEDFDYYDEFDCYCESDFNEDYEHDSSYLSDETDYPFKKLEKFSRRNFLFEQWYNHWHDISELICPLRKSTDSFNKVSHRGFRLNEFTYRNRPHSFDDDFIIDEKYLHNGALFEDRLPLYVWFNWKFYVDFVGNYTLDDKYITVAEELQKYRRKKAENVRQIKCQQYKGKKKNRPGKGKNDMNQQKNSALTLIEQNLDGFVPSCSKVITWSDGIENAYNNSVKNTNESASKFPGRGTIGGKLKSSPRDGKENLDLMSVINLDGFVPSHSKVLTWDDGIKNAINNSVNNTNESDSKFSDSDTVCRKLKTSPRNVEENLDLKSTTAVAILDGFVPSRSKVITWSDGITNAINNSVNNTNESASKFPGHGMIGGKLKSSPSNGNKGQAVLKKEKKKCALGKKERLAAKLVVGKN